MASDKAAEPGGHGSDATVVRALTSEDLDAVVAIDEALTGRSRRGFFERRLRAALKEPKGYIYVGAERGGGLKGYVLVRLLGGEFGQDAAGKLDAIGVDPKCGGAGLGGALMGEVEDIMRHKGVEELQTETEWSNSGLLGFLAHVGFEHAPRIVLKRDVASDLE
jgi:ribosomal protein S18 acetylase RimI-like enzyme